MGLFNLNRFIRNEEKASKHINVLTHYDDETLIDKSGKLIKIIKVSGLNYMTLSDESLDIYKTRRNHLLKSFSSDFAVYTWEVRRKISNYPAGQFAEGYANDVNEKYRQQIQSNDTFHTEHYLAVMAKQPEGLINKGLSFIKQLSLRIDKQAKQTYLAKRHQELNDAALKIMGAFYSYDCELLTVYKKHDVKFSAPLSFLSQLINYDFFPVPLKIQDAAQVLPRKRLFFNDKAGSIELRAADGSKKFVAMLSIKAYSPITYQGILNEISNLRCEFTITQSYCFYDKQGAKARMRDQQHEMLQSNEESVSQTEQIADVFDETASGEVGYGKHHLTLACFALNQEELTKHISQIVALFADKDIACVREDIACEMAFWSQLPGNFRYIARAADISTLNMAGLASFHNCPKGKLSGNHWGDAVTVFETLSGSPYYFNFHYKDVGNFLVFGAMGSGKTVLIGFLILQSMKFGGKRIIFDKDGGLEIAVRIMGGTYERMKPGIKTGFNPCQLKDTLENRAFLSALFKRMLIVNGEVLSENNVAEIEKAINGLYRLPLSMRQLCHIASFFGVKKPGSLRARFDQWHSEGAYAWLFDNETDSLNLDADVIGIDIGSILADKECKTPALMYLMHRIEQALYGKRGIIFIDEGWLALGDEYFKVFINNWSRTPRKKNYIFGLATQAANDTIDLPISKSINESAFCKFFFPNPSAERRVYIDGLGLSEREFDLIKTLPDNEHYFLHVHGRGASRESVVLKLNLKSMQDEIAVISARENTLMLFDQIRSEVGNDPARCLKLFHERRESI